MYLPNLQSRQIKLSVYTLASRLLTRMTAEHCPGKISSEFQSWLSTLWAKGLYTHSLQRATMIEWIFYSLWEYCLTSALSERTEKTDLIAEKKSWDVSKVVVITIHEQPAPLLSVIVKWEVYGLDSLTKACSFFSINRGRLLSG